MQATSMDEVIHYLQQITDTARIQKSRLGYFAALYFHVATRLEECVNEGAFENKELVEKLNVCFFNRYFEALDLYQRGELPPQSWLVAFKAAQSRRPIVNQHLMLGMNAHINFDLGIAVARTCPAEWLPVFHRDFNKLNAILISLVEDVTANLTMISPMLGLLNHVHPKDAIINFSMRRARGHAWRVANRLAPMSQSDQVAEIDRLDRWVARFGYLIWKPGPLLTPLLATIRVNERGTVAEIIDFLLHKGDRRKAKRPVDFPAPKNGQRTRVAILGGGIAALTVAFELTDPNRNPHHKQYDVTVYQMGWRLGGKGASGRNMDPEYHYRIEEHGLHAWFGFYDNAFRLIRRCYQELGRPPDAPLASWDDAFKPVSFSTLVEHKGIHWPMWPMETPTDDQLPGDGSVLLPLQDYLTLALKLMHSLYHHSPSAKTPPSTGTSSFEPGLRTIAEKIAVDLGAEGLILEVKLLYAAYRLSQWLGQEPERLAHWLEGDPDNLAQWLGKALDKFVHSLYRDIHELTHEIILALLDAFMNWLWQDVGPGIGTDIHKYRLWITMNFIYAHVHGVIKDNVISRGFASINDKDYREWLEQYAFPDNGVTITSELVSTLYDSSFAYHDGKASMEAGTALQGLVRTVFTYKGAFAWLMQAATGDTIFVPLYQVLKRRGVKFEFFHRVQQLHYADDAYKSINRIDVVRQVTIKSDRNGNRAYQPLIDVKGLPCWPSTPLTDQIENGDQLKDANINLELPYTRDEWPDVELFTLEAGVHFDKVVLGIPISVLPSIAPKLIQASTKWQGMITHVKTTRTQALQLWLKPTANELGWPWPPPVMSFTYDQIHLPNPLNTWGNLSHLIPRENWTAACYPLSIAYFCSAMLDAPQTTIQHVPEDSAIIQRQARENARVYQSAVDLLNGPVGVLWPKAVETRSVEGRNGRLERINFKWRLLIDDREGEHRGEERLRSQYWRANVAPSERYTLSVPGSSRYRLPANDPDEFPNLYLAGDWTDNGLNVGCMEAAVMSGMLAAGAISGYPTRREIIGLDFGRGSEKAVALLTPVSTETETNNVVRIRTGQS